MKPIRVALIGYGNAGRIFHAPLISGVPGLQLAVVCSSKPEQVRRDWPQTLVVPTPQDVFHRTDVDLVVIATSNESHHPLARQALLAGKHVVVDKPCTVTLAETQDLLSLAEIQGKVLTVFQNRRWDADFLSLKEVLESGVLGRIVHFESHFDRYRPEVPNRWREKDLPGSGLWFDLGPHLVDQCLQLFGMPDDISLDLAQQRDGAQVNDYFHAQLRYASSHPGLRVILHASALVPAAGPRFVLHGTQGSLVKYGFDVQEEALKAGARPKLGDSGWGVDPQPGTLTIYRGKWIQTCEGPNVAGDYSRFYAGLQEFLSGKPGSSLPVKATEVLEVMRILELGQQGTSNLMVYPDKCQTLHSRTP
jgi:predicted dehydrogenase